ncbi:hypothetical protein [Streptomyces sp. NRRL F-5630]|uniref:hypothetical protein n=1 Tax=Streptomyces sp. NRRL F-5630 TaxID=1463864 RepID=UPI003D710F1F
MPLDRDAALYALLRAEARRRSEPHRDNPTEDRQTEPAPEPEPAQETPAPATAPPPSPRPAAQSEMRSSHSPMS